MRNPQEIREKILFEPAAQGADTLRIASGYASHTMAAWHISEIAKRFRKSVNIELIVGMCIKDMLFRPVHKGLLELMNTTPSFTCKYIVQGKPEHSSLYLWEKEGSPFAAYTGSAYYTTLAFFGKFDETMISISAGEAEEIFNEIEPDTMLCTDPEIEKHIIITDSPGRLDIYWDKDWQLN